MKSSFRYIENKTNFVVVLACVYAIVFGLISFVNHWNYETYCLDLGAYTNALFEYRNLRLATTATFEEVPKFLLGDHFDFYLILFSPLSFFLRTNTLLVVQFVAIFIGFIGLRKLGAHLKTPIVNQISFSFLSFFGVITAFGFDYHSNVVAACLIPWIVYFVRSRQSILFYITLFFFLLSKENSGIIICFILISILIYHWRSVQVVPVIAAALLSIIYSVLVIQFVMPSISNTEHYIHFNYVGGSNMKEFLINGLLHPLEFMKALFGNHLGGHNNIVAIKMEFLVFTFLSGAALLFARPFYFLPFIPLLIQKFLNTNPNIVGVGSHYSFEFGIISLCFIPFITSNYSFKWQKNIGYALLLCSLIVTIRTMDNTINYIPKNRVRFYQEQHYVREDIGRETINKCISLIPTNASVSCPSNILPHLSLRKNIYQFPLGLKSDFIIIGKFKNPFPIDINERRAIRKKIINGGQYSMVFNLEGLQLFKKRVN